MKVWICEKPDQAKALAGVLGVKELAKGYIKTGDGAVTWCYGHMLQLQGPEFYNPALKSWNIESLPVVPREWEVREPFTGSDFDKVRLMQLGRIKLLLEKASTVIIATDGDREGECIGREVLDYFGYQGGIERLWYSALDDVSIKRALAKILPGKATAALYDAARARARADWLVGMNMTMGVTTALGQGGGVLSVGRVQTPTLGLVVRRDLAIEGFASRKYFELVASVKAGECRLDLRHAPAAQPEDGRFYDKAKAESVCREAAGFAGTLAVSTDRKKQGPKKLFSLSALQKTTNAKWGWSADKTLKVAQALYDKHKLTSYPRSDCQFLPAEHEADIPDILGHLKTIEEFKGYIPANPVVRKSVFNTAKVTAHYAITPTTKAARLGELSADESKAYLLISAHYVAALMGDYIYDQTSVVLDVNGRDFKASGRVDIEAGWKALLGPQDGEDQEEDGKALPAVRNDDAAKVESVSVDEKATKAPARYTEGTLIADMESVAKFVDNQEQKKMLRDTSGLGTEATRAAIIEVLKKRGFLTLKGKQILSSDLGRALVDALPARLVDPAETAVWEDRLEDIAKGRAQAGEFIQGIEKHVKDQLEQVRVNASKGVRIGEKKAPTVPMIKAAEAVAKENGEDLPTECRASYSNCRNYLEKNKETLRAMRAKPTEKMLEYGKKIAASMGVVFPAIAGSNREACSEFIEANQGQLGPSPKQLRFAQEVAKASSIELPEACSASAAACSAFIDANKKPGGKRKAAGKRPAARRSTQRRKKAAA